jgi:hypothetical protein
MKFRSMAAELIDDLPEKDSPEFKYKEEVVRNSCSAAYIGKQGSLTTLSMLA